MPLRPPASLARAVALPGRPEVRILLVEAGLACCGLEVGSALTQGLLAEVDVPAGTGQAPSVSVLAISGTITTALAPALETIWAGIDGPRAAIAFGACATAGGPYWDAPQVRAGADGLIPVDVVVAGCPPRPGALAEAIAQAADAALARAS